MNNFDNPIPSSPNQKPLWSPDPQRIAASQMQEFHRFVSKHYDAPEGDYMTLHNWSTTKHASFWKAIWDFCGIIGERGQTVLNHGEAMFKVRWFPDARLNFAENLLRQRDNGRAIIYRDENQQQQRWHYDQLYNAVSVLAQALRDQGCVAGDRIAVYLPNIPETVIAMLAAASFGAIFSSVSPDFGVHGVVDRFKQIKPKVLFGVDGYLYAGKHYDTLGQITAIVDKIPSIERVIIVPSTRYEPDISGIRHATIWNTFVHRYRAAPINFTPLPFAHPLYILYSSGTTGNPKCIVHSAGGTLLQHLKELRLHCDLKAGERILYMTTCSWMMWNWLISALACEATLMLYNGAPFHPTPNAIFDYVAAERIHIFGTSAKYLDAVKKVGIVPEESHDLSALRLILSTGSPLASESFDFVYQNIKSDVCLSSISGGTDIISCFLLGNPTLPVHRGEIQCAGLGMKVAVFDNDGKPVIGEKGELVCTRTFPSMPLGFWNDEDQQHYYNAYFARFPGVWHHGDFIMLTTTGSAVIYGRSDTVLNPGGVRIGTAEIYRPVEQLAAVTEALVVGQEWQGDVRIVLFVVLQRNYVLNDPLISLIKQQIRTYASPRHVPSHIIQVDDIPCTTNGKIAELAVRDIIHGREVHHKEVLANPEALRFFRNLDALG